ncbi:hypothetical protein QBC44DRAFT_345418 [Cladorrhinum sp. PSN332]|nr:hypothetical protein QBC44DRAFT_345418 [Cladorrhinum sp. PSN332]
MPATRTSTHLTNKNTIEKDALSSRSAPRTTQDGHHVIVKGRKWRATDPSVPDEAVAELKYYLAMGRSGIREPQKGQPPDEEKIKLLRHTAALSKVGLGQRGKPEWWNDTDENRKERWESALACLRELHNRST